MRKTVAFNLALFASCMIYVLCAASVAGCAEREVMGMGTSLHYAHPEYNVGDVHPYYDDNSRTWHMIYLRPENYASRLLTSNDMLQWKEADIKYSGRTPVSYFILGILKDGAGAYRSYYGTSSHFGCSESTDLIKWNNASGMFNIPFDIFKYFSGARDPYAFFDPDEDVWRCVSTAYRSRSADWKVMDVSIALASTSGNDLTSWGKNWDDLIRFPDITDRSGEPECPQMIKIGSRWYLLASQYDGVNDRVGGGPNYWFSSENKGIGETDWQNVEKYTLDGKDLCAGQLVQKDDRYYLFGWIPYWKGGWGGQITLPREVYQLSDGRLAVRLDPDAGNAIRGKKLASVSGRDLGTGGELALKGTYDRLDFEGTLTLNQAEASVILGDIDIRVNSITNTLAVMKASDGTLFSSINLLSGELDKTISIRIIVEDDIIEVFIDDHYALAARVDEALNAVSARIVVRHGDATVDTAAVYHLKYLEEIAE